MKKTLLKRVWVLAGMALAMVCFVGCTSISLESNKDPAAVRKLNRLFVLINQGDTKNKPLSQSLSSAFREYFTNGTPQVDIAIASSLDLDESAMRSRMAGFTPDAILTISAVNYVVDPYGNYPRIVYDVSLFDPIAKRRIWRASIDNSGSTDFMDRRMREMARKIVQQLQLDGFL